MNVEIPNLSEPVLFNTLPNGSTYAGNGGHVLKTSGTGGVRLLDGGNVTTGQTEIVVPTNLKAVPA